jgi:hypothetical protein
MQLSDDRGDLLRASRLVSPVARRRQEVQQWVAQPSLAEAPWPAFLRERQRQLAYWPSRSGSSNQHVTACPTASPKSIDVDVTSRQPFRVDPVAQHWCIVPASVGIGCGGVTLVPEPLLTSRHPPGPGCACSAISRTG